ncbi:MAG TPA: helix-turn-helix transcriptional regulator [Candidatus Limnocylindrales bacterium]|nr:helix-turn-helix transcriptional regulator [Candidatus Limnocylindrales bacterium]
MLVDVGRVIADARSRARWSQRELSRRSGVSQAEICRVERAGSSKVSLATLDHLLSVLGVRYRFEFDVPGSPVRQRDAVHAWALGSLRRRLGRMGFDVAGEVEIGGDRSRGWIDVLAFRGVDGLLAVGEFKSDLVDLGALERQVAWYEREATMAASRRGWRPSRVISVAFVLATAVNDDRVKANAALLREAFPGRAQDLEHAFARGGPAHRRFLVMIDPASRSPSWILPTAIERPRRTPPYRDYADAARRAARR